MNCFPNSRCGGCYNFLKTTEVNARGREVTYKLPNRKLYNRDVLCICIAQPVPDDASEGAIIKFEMDGQAFNAINPHANYVYADQIRSRRIYKFSVATDVRVFKYCGGERLCPTDSTYPIVNPRGFRQAKDYKAENPVDDKAEVKKVGVK